MPDAKPPAVNGHAIQTLDADMAARVDRANAYHKSFRASAEQVAVYAFLAGLQLNAIKESIKHGQFMAFCENFLPDIPHRSATRYMAFAGQIGHVANLPTVGNVKLLANGRLPEKEETKLLDAFREEATGKTLTELYRDTGVIRDEKDRGRKPGEKPKKLSLSEQAALRKELAQKDWRAIDEGLFVYADKFTILDDDDVTAQIARLEAALKARKAWLKQPVNKRDPKAIEAMFGGPVAVTKEPEKQAFSAYVNRWGTLCVKAYDPELEIESLKSPSVFAVIRRVEASTLEEAYDEAARRYRERHCDITFAAQDQKLPIELKR